MVLCPTLVLVMVIWPWMFLMLSMSPALMNLSRLSRSMLLKVTSPELVHSVMLSSVNNEHENVPPRSSSRASVMV